MSIVGRNTPQSVLSYIDAIWAKNAPPDPLELSRELGHDPKRYRRLKEKHGDGLLAHLQKEQRHRTEQTLFMAKQDGLLHPPQYVSSVEGAIDDAEAVPAEYQDVVVLEAKGRFAEHRQQNAKQEHAEENARQVGRQLRDLAVAIHRNGGDPVEFLAGVQRQITEKRNELRDAA